MNAQKHSYYIPVTMDELMARFVTNIQRNECKTRFSQEKKRLFSNKFAEMPSDQIEESVNKSMQAIKDLLSNNTIEMERQPNSENNLYLRLMERAQEENELHLINMHSSKKYRLVKTQKPRHLQHLQLQHLKN